MQKPRARVIRGETESHIVASLTRRNNITTNLQKEEESGKADYVDCGRAYGIFVVIDRAFSTSDDIKGMLKGINDQGK
jgi:hypothetical protein